MLNVKERPSLLFILSNTWCMREWGWLPSHLVEWPFVLYVGYFSRWRLCRGQVSLLSLGLCYSHLISYFVTCGTFIRPLLKFIHLGHYIGIEKALISLQYIFVFMFSISLQLLLKLLFWDEGNSQVNRNSKKSHHSWYYEEKRLKSLCFWKSELICMFVFTEHVLHDLYIWHVYTVFYGKEHIAVAKVSLKLWCLILETILGVDDSRVLEPRRLISVGFVEYLQQQSVFANVLLAYCMPSSVLCYSPRWVSSGILVLKAQESPGWGQRRH